MNKIKRAIIMAAGKGTRLAPITNEIPKPLIKVNGKRMIETIIDTLHNNGIFEIYVVVGYKKENFKELKDVILIENPYFETCNNISSLYMARDYLEDAIILDGDQIIYNENILTPLFEKSGYNCLRIEGEETKEWVLDVENNQIKSCNRNGGNNGWQLFSVSRWNARDGKILKECLEEEFEKKNNTQLYWDDVPLFCHKEKFNLGIMKMKKGDIIEIDNLNELIEIDETYKKYKIERN